MGIQLRTLGIMEVTDARGVEIEALMRQPKRLALFAYLATKRPSPVESRDALLGLFWPELDQDHARNALNKALHFLRRALGQGVVVGHGRARVGIDPERVASDVAAFRDSLDVDGGRESLSLYLGDFLPGFYISDVPAFDQWLEGERRWYRDRARLTGLTLLGADLDRGRVQSAVEWAGALNRIAPNDEDVVRATVRAHLRAGDRPSALARLERYETWLAETLDMGVPAELVRLLNDAPPSSAPARTVHTTGDPPPELLAQSREAIRVETLEEYRNFVDQLPDPTYRCDLRGSFPFVNRAFTSVTGWTADEVRDMSYDQLIREDFRDRAIEFYVRQVDEHIPVTYLEFPAILKDGTEIWVGQKVRLLERDGMPVGIEAVTRDITTRIRRETANRRTSLEDRETRLLNREAFFLMAQQRIRENRRTGEQFFVIHVQLKLDRKSGPYDATRAALAARIVGRTLVFTVRESDVVGRIDEMEVAVLVPRGSTDDAAALCSRVDAALAETASLPELQGVSLSCQPVIHDARKLSSAEALMTFAWVLEDQG